MQNERTVSSWIKVEDDAPAVLRALADGKRVRHGTRRAAPWLRLGNDGTLWDEWGSRLTCYFDFSSTWFIETPRDIVTDPQVGDEFLWDGDRAKVVAVDGGFVFFHDGAEATGYTPKEWASAFESGYFKRIEAEK